MPFVRMDAAFGRVPAWIVSHERVRHSDLRVYCVLAAYGEYESARAEMTFGRMAELGNMSRGTVHKGVERLVEIGAITVERGTGTNPHTYVLMTNDPRATGTTIGGSGTRGKHERYPQRAAAVPVGNPTVLTENSPDTHTEGARKVVRPRTVASDTWRMWERVAGVRAASERDRAREVQRVAFVLEKLPGGPPTEDEMAEIVRLGCGSPAGWPSFLAPLRTNRQNVDDAWEQLRKRQEGQTA